MASNTQPSPSLYATPGPPIKLLALPYVAVIVIARTKPPKLRSPRKYSCRKELEALTRLLAHIPTIKIITKNPINENNASQFICSHPHHRKGLPQKTYKQ